MTDTDYEYAQHVLDEFGRKAEAAITLIQRQKNRTPWTYGPEWYWSGWRTLVPWAVGHDEYCRVTLVLGWTFTGRAVFPLWDCGDGDCHQDAIKWIQEEE